MNPGAAANGLVISLRKGCVQKSRYIMEAVDCISRPPQRTTLTDFFILPRISLHSAYLFVQSLPRHIYNGCPLHSTPLWTGFGPLALANSEHSDRQRENLRMALLAVR
jgi:hypothetical protein